SIIHGCRRVIIGLPDLRYGLRQCVDKKRVESRQLRSIYGADLGRRLDIQHPYTCSSDQSQAKESNNIRQRNFCQCGYRQLNQYPGDNYQRDNRQERIDHVKSYQAASRQLSIDIVARNEDQRGGALLEAHEKEDQKNG